MIPTFDVQNLPPVTEYEVLTFVGTFLFTLGIQHFFFKSKYTTTTTTDIVETVKPYKLGPPPKGKGKKFKKRHENSKRYVAAFINSKNSPSSSSGS